MNKEQKFWDRIADRYSKRPVSDPAAYEKKLEITRAYLRPEFDVLEFGCGTGSTAIEHAPHVRNICAIDISSRMIEIARDKAAAAGIDNIRFEQATLEEAVRPDGTLDAVLGLNILHLLEDWQQAIARVGAMLRPGGIFVSSTMCLGDDMKFFRYIGPIGHWLGLFPLIQVFTARELVDALTDAGFAIERQWQPGKRKGVFIVARKAE